MESILVTGAAGNIGSTLVAKLCSQLKYQVLALDNLSTGSLAKLPPRDTKGFRFIKADVNDFNDLSAVFLANRPEYVYHLAAVVGVQRTLSNPLNVLNDIEGIRNILSLAKNTGVRRVFYSSSSEIYGEPVCLPQNEETTPLNSRLPYAIVKNVGEAYFRSYYGEHGLPYTIFRFFNTYGPGQSQDFVIPRFLGLALRNEPIPIYGDGSQRRTFCFVDDTVEVMLRCLEDGHFINDVLNVGSDAEISVLDLARLIVKMTGSRSQIIHLPPLREGDMSRRSPDTRKMHRILGRPLQDLEGGLMILIKGARGAEGAM